VQAVQAVRHARHSYTWGDIQIATAAEYLNGLWREAWFDALVG
jgi:hypothetical protein